MFEVIQENIASAWLNFNPVLAVAILIAYVLIDALNAYYTLSVTRLRAMPAANASLLIFLLISFGVINYTKNYLYIVSVVIGGWLGTYLMVRWQASRAKQKKIVTRHHHSKS